MVSLLHEIVCTLIVELYTLIVDPQVIRQSHTLLALTYRPNWISGGDTSALLSTISRLYLVTHTAKQLNYFPVSLGGLVGLSTQ